MALLAGLEGPPPGAGPRQATPAPTPDPEDDEESFDSEGRAPARRSRYPGDDDRAQALGLVGGIPIVRDMASVFEGHDYSVTPAAGVVKSAINVGKDMGHALGMIDGEVSEKWLRHAVEMSGYALGLPTGQASSTAQFLWDAMDGSEDPQGVQEWLHGLVYGPEHKG